MPLLDVLRLFSIPSNATPGWLLRFLNWFPFCSKLLLNVSDIFSGLGFQFAFKATIESLWFSFSSKATIGCLRCFRVHSMPLLNISDDFRRLMPLLDVLTTLSLRVLSPSFQVLLDIPCHPDR